MGGFDERSGAEEFASLEEGECFVNVEEMFGVFCVGESVFHHLKQHPRQSFLLGFGIDPELLKVTRDRRLLEGIMSSFLCVEQEPHLMDSQYDGMAPNECRAISARGGKCIANNRVYPVQGIQRARDILSSYTASIECEQQKLPLLVAVQADPAEDEQDVLYIGKGVTQDTELFTVQVRDAHKSDLLRSVRELTGVSTNGASKVCVKGVYDIWGSSADESSRGSLVLYWECDPAAFTGLLQPPQRTTPTRCYFLLRGSSESEQSSLVQGIDSKFRILMELHNCSTGTLDTTGRNRPGSVIDKSDWETVVKAFIYSSGAVKRSEQQSSGDAPVHKIIHSDKDFTEAFWETVVCNDSATILQVMDAVREMSRALHDGTLLPFVSKDNHTFFGEYCRRAIAEEKRRKFETDCADVESKCGMSAREFRLVGDMLENICAKKTQQLVAAKLFELGCFVLGTTMETSLSSHVPAWSFPSRKQEGDSLGDQAAARLVVLRDSLQLCSIAGILNCPSEVTASIVKQSLSRLSSDSGQDVCTVGEITQMKQNRIFPYFVVAADPDSSWIQEVCKALPSPVHWRLRTAVAKGKERQFTFVQPSSVDSLFCTTSIDAGELSRTLDNSQDCPSTATCPILTTSIPLNSVRGSKWNVAFRETFEGLDVFQTEVNTLNLQYAQLSN